MDLQTPMATHTKSVLIVMVYTMMLGKMMLTRMMLGRFTAMRATLERHPATRLGKLMRANSIAKVKRCQRKALQW